MYSITRQEAADKLSVSTRSIDRYIKAWKLRSRKEGKIIYIHSQDIENLIWASQEKTPEVIIPETKTSYTQDAPRRESVSNEIADTQSRATLEKIYLDLRSEIKQKDSAIQELSLKLGQAQEIAKNSISLVEYKKSQFLLEESKWHISQELSTIKQKSQELSKKLQYEKFTNYILIVFCIILLIGLGFLWFLSI